MALLYSWAKIENAHYRDFSRPPKTLSCAPAQTCEQGTTKVPGGGWRATSSNDVASSVCSSGFSNPCSATGDVCRSAVTRWLESRKSDARKNSRLLRGTVTGTTGLVSPSFCAVATAGMQAGPHEPNSR